MTVIQAGGAGVLGVTKVLQPSEQGVGHPADIAGKIAATLRQMGVVGLPRNYELFYEAYTGSNRELVSDILGLGGRLTQDALDTIGERHLAHHRRQSMVENTRDTIERKIEEVMVLLLREKKSLESYSQFLDETSDGIRNRASLTRELLEKVVDLMTSATDATISHGHEIVSSIADKSAELKTLKAKLEEYKKLAETDPLTELWNRRAFERRMAKLYESPKSVIFGALIVADIDNFKRINDQFGHPVGDRIIQSIAKLLKASLPGDVFIARTGGEEFAFILEGLSEASVAALAEDVRRATERGIFIDRETGRNCGPISMSLGVCMAADAASADDLYGKADKAMYASKTGGRNRVTLHPKQQEKPQLRKDWLLYKTE
jgi:diguanylate cyclase